MGKKRFTDEQIVPALRQAEGDEKLGEICRHMGSVNRRITRKSESMRGWD